MIHAYRDAVEREMCFICRNVNEDLAPCNKCGLLACPDCRWGTGDLIDGYWHSNECQTMTADAKMVWALVGCEGNIRPKPRSTFWGRVKELFTRRF